MNSYVIDTNVLIVANGKHSNANYEHVHICQTFLNEMRKKMVSLDTLGLILKEYFTHARRSGQPGIGDAFAKWIWDNQGIVSRCERVEITPAPDDEALKEFDPSDQKFAAVALQSKYDTIICNATDSDWWDFKTAFESHGITIKFLCPELIKK